MALNREPGTGEPRLGVPRSWYEPPMPQAVWMLLVLGTVARLWGYRSAGSLWLDELFIVNNLHQRSLAELLTPLDYGQNAPVGWLLLAKSVSLVLGEAEWALRLPSLCASLLSLPLAYRVAYRAVGRDWAWLPLLLVALNPFVIWQGLQLKPYALDLLVALVLLDLTGRLLEDSAKASEKRLAPLDPLDLMPLGLIGGVAIFFSMPAIFVLGAIGCVLWWRLWRRQARALIGLGALWLAAFAVNLHYFLRPSEQPAWLVEYWTAGLLPWPFASWSDLRWFDRVLAAAMEQPVGFLQVGGVALVPVAIGVGGWLLAWRWRGLAPPVRLAGAMLSLTTLPVLLALLAAMVQRYPFADRLVLFLVPSLGILFACGCRILATSRWLRWPLRVAVGVLLAVPVVFFAAWLPRGGLPIAADSRALFDRLPTDFAPGEVVVLDHVTTHAWRYYGRGRALEMIAVPPAWSDRDRVRSLRQTLVRQAGRRQVTAIWLVANQVTATPRRPLGEALRLDLHQRRFGFPAAWDWLVDEQTRWMQVDRLVRAMPPSWQIKDSQTVYGGLVWRLERAMTAVESGPEAPVVERP